MTTDDFRALCADLTDALHNAIRVIHHEDGTLHISTAEPVLDRARAALARWGHPAPVPVSEPVAWLWEYIGSDPYPHKFSPVARSLREMDPANPPFPDDWRPVAPLYLARWGHQPAPPAAGEQRHPEPVPVSERLPGPEMCWWWIEPDEDDDDSGYGGSWTLLRIRGNKVSYTHWLPAHALPLPAGE